MNPSVPPVSHFAAVKSTLFQRISAKNHNRRRRHRNA